MSWVDDLADFGSTVADVLGDSVDTWDKVFGSMGGEQPGTVQAQPSAPGGTAPATATPLASDGLSTTDMLLIGGALVLAVVLLK